ncbi:MAG: hypothetical protein M3Q03_01215 [Chloroflexota bacterium]|nr:hypothetical protein [Chloroflexota bacterium]
MLERGPEDLARYWDALAEGVPPGPRTLDPTLTEAVRRFHAAPDVDGPDPAFLARLWEDLQRAQPVPGPAAGVNDRYALRRWLSSVSAPLGPGSRLRRVSVSFATATLLVLTVGLVLYALRPDRRDMDRPGDLPTQVSSPVAAPVATPDAAPVVEETLVTVPLPREAFPPGDNVSAVVFMPRVPQGTRTTWPPPTGYCCSGLRVDHVLAGMHTVRASGPIQVVRAGGEQPETIPAGAEVLLRPGDTMMATIGTAFESGNFGATPVELVCLAILNANAASAPVLPGWIEDHDNRGLAPRWPLPAGPALLQLRRVVLAPAATLPPPPAGFQVAEAVSEAASLGVSSDNAIRNLGREATTVYVANLEAAGAAAATPGIATAAP